MLNANSEAQSRIHSPPRPLSRSARSTPTTPTAAEAAIGGSKSGSGSPSVRSPSTPRRAEGHAACTAADATISAAVDEARAADPAIPAAGRRLAALAAAQAAEEAAAAELAAVQKAAAQQDAAQQGAAGAADGELSGVQGTALPPPPPLPPSCSSPPGHTASRAPARLRGSLPSPTAALPRDGVGGARGLALSPRRLDRATLTVGDRGRGMGSADATALAVGAAISAVGAAAMGGMERGACGAWGGRERATRAAGLDELIFYLERNQQLLRYRREQLLERNTLLRAELASAGVRSPAARVATRRVMPARVPPARDPPAHARDPVARARERGTRTRTHAPPTHAHRCARPLASPTRCDSIWVGAQAARPRARRTSRTTTRSYT